MVSLTTGVTVLALAAVVGFLRAGRFFPRSPDRAADATWLTGSEHPGADVVELVARYLDRVRAHRWNGALIGGGLALLRGLLDQQVSVGIGSGSPLGDLLFGGLAGLLVGSVLAETWRLDLRRPARRAELIPRVPEREATALRPVVAVLTTLTVVLGVISPGIRSVLLASASMALMVTHRLVLRAVAERGRPALPVDLRRADDAVRAYAARRLGVETLAAAILVFGWQLDGVAPSALGPLTGAVTTASLVVTVLLIRRSRPWPAAVRGTDPRTARAD